MKYLNSFVKKLKVSQIIALSFVLVILCGTFLLSLPFSIREGGSSDFITALFTSTSATCVTGLSLCDTFTNWSFFGQLVILLMIQIGGLGFMSIASIVIFAFRSKIRLTELLVMADSIGTDNLKDVSRIQKRLLSVSFGLEAAGALILWLCFIKDYGVLYGLWLGIFHSISAYCNAGFDIFGFINPGESLCYFATNYVVMITISVLIVVGGIGFLVIDEIYRVKKFKKFSVYTKLVLITTASLIIGGAVGFFVLECTNPSTIESLSLPDKLLVSLFQSITTRTAGFASIDQGALAYGSKALTIMLMFIGGSSGSTAGGFKTVTAVVILLFLKARFKGKNEIVVFSRRIEEKKVLDALMLFCLMVLASFMGGLIISASNGFDFVDSLYESISALATVGLSTGITSSLNLFSKCLIIVFMFLGRVGLLTISMSLLKEDKGESLIRYPRTNVLIG